MDIRGLGYVGVDVADLASWRVFAADLGTMVVGGADDAFGIKIDERQYRVHVQRAEAGQGLAFSGWELTDAAALDEAVGELESEGLAVEHASDDELGKRQVRGLARTTDPAGNPVELFWGPILDHERFTSPAGVSSFVTGDMGLGHIVLGVPDVDEAADFYLRIMGFRVSDYWKPGPTDVIFTRCNPRHHSLALVAASEPALYHFMLEARSLDDVGYTLDRLRDSGVRISMGLGRHTNDQMVSFYCTSPAGFDVEFGCDGLRVDDATWSISQITQPSFWGHRAPRPSGG